MAHTLSVVAGLLPASLLALVISDGAAATVAGELGGSPLSQVAAKSRARDLGVPFEGQPGALNAITDVAGVTVGHTTIVEGRGELVVGQGPVRTGVTVIWPRGDTIPDPVFAAWFSLNGDGEMTGTTWMEDRGMLDPPIAITNTLSVGAVHHAVIRYGVERGLSTGNGRWLNALPVVAETWDGTLNDIRGQHVTESDVMAALEAAKGGRVAEGNVGGGTGMICHRFKGGIGTASRVVAAEGQSWTVGVLVQCNYGARDLLRVAGVPVGREITDLMPERASAPAPGMPLPEPVPGERAGSIIVVVATDAPLLPNQLKRVARRVSLGLARNGSVSTGGSGDIFVAFSTANQEAARAIGSATMTVLSNDRLDGIFRATVEATEEAVINALVAAETMTGANDVTVHALPHDRLREVLRKYGRLEG